MGKREKSYLFVRLVSAAGTGFFYVARKSRKGNMAQQKLEFRKYDPRVNRHVLFTEAKMKWQPFMTPTSHFVLNQPHLHSCFFGFFVFSCLSDVTFELFCAVSVESIQWPNAFSIGINLKLLIKLWFIVFHRETSMIWCIFLLPGEWIIYGLFGLDR